MPFCPYCKKKITMSKAFCSNDCRDDYFHFISIQIPKPFINRLYTFHNASEREIEIIKYSKLHNMKLKLLRKKIYSAATKAGFLDSSNRSDSALQSTYGG
jgi:hypothetical protein